MNIGAAARATGLSARMIRYYERMGLVPGVARGTAGYRRYTDNDLHRLRFIRQARELGFPLPDIATLLDLWDDASRHSADVKRMADRHIRTLRERMEDLRRMIDALQTLVDSCAGDDRPECPILAGLGREPRDDVLPTRHARTTPGRAASTEPASRPCRRRAAGPGTSASG